MQKMLRTSEKHGTIIANEGSRGLVVMAVDKIYYKVVFSSNPGAEHKTNIISKLFIVKCTY